MKDVLKSIGAQVRDLRGGKSQEEFAKIIGLPKSRVSPIEQGKANLTIKTLSQIAARTKKKLRVMFTT